MFFIHCRCSDSDQSIGIGFPNSGGGFDRNRFPNPRNDFSFAFGDAITIGPLQDHQILPPACHPRTKEKGDQKNWLCRKELHFDFSEFLAQREFTTPPIL